MPPFAAVNSDTAQMTCTRNPQGTLAQRNATGGYELQNGPDGTSIATRVADGARSRLTAAVVLYIHIVMQLTGYVSARLDATFAALADPTRRAILARLSEGEASVTQLAAPFAISQPAISKHLKVLERAGLVSRGRDAQRRPVRLEMQPLTEATDWLERHREAWAANFQRLDALLEDLKAQQKKD